MELLEAGPVVPVRPVILQQTEEGLHAALSPMYFKLALRGHPGREPVSGV